MGLATFVVGLLPGYQTIGYAAPTIFIICRLLQGLALGGEYGGAATYVAEHSPQGRRGFYTSWIQTTATVGLFLSLIVILGLRLSMTPGDVRRLGLARSVPALHHPPGFSIWIRLQLAESPAFQKMKEEGTRSKAPLTEAFGRWENAKIGLIALFGGTAGQAVVWYTGQFYALFFLTQTLKVDGTTANLLIAFGLLIGTPFFVLFGWLSDKIGRKKILLAGCLIAAVTYFPLFKMIAQEANPKLIAATEQVKVELTADPATCGSLFDPVGVRTFTRPCDVARRTLANNSIHYDLLPGPAGSALAAKVNGTDVPTTDNTGAAIVAAARGGGLSEGRRRHDREAADGRRRVVRCTDAEADRPSVHPRSLRDDGVRADRGACWSNCSRPASAIPACRCPITSATVGSAASCHRPPSPSWRRPAISSPASGTRSSSR